MKRILYLFVGMTGIAMAQTNITTPTVSGTWTMAGSPYIIQNEITVQATDVLVIQPGVIVKFQPATRLEVFGQLIASGNSNNTIIFEAADTNGWHDELTTVGGWNGIHFHPYGGSGIDNSILNYCILQDAKYGYATILNYMYPISIERGLKVHNCKFRHNQTFSGMVGSGATLWAQKYISTDTLDIDKCEFTGNISFSSVISINSYVGYNRVTNTHIHHNEDGSGITGLGANILIENNEIDHNNTMYDSAPLYITADSVVIRGNEIHHNVSPDHGGMNCNYGKITVENNFIHNNYQTDAACGLSEGGGGMNLTCFGGNINASFFIVRNNIIANNYSNYGGGGINVYEAIACITNNHIINNDSPNYGRSIFIAHPNSRVYMRSNIFYDQTSPGNIESQDLVHIYNGSWIWFDYNFITANYSQVVQTNFSYTLMGDTMHNVIGLDPGIEAPTINNSYLTDASTADFTLISTSDCIDAGDTVGAYISTVDYANNNRLNGLIDIGAYEYGTGEPAGWENMNDEMFNMQIYPNPAEANTGFNVFTPASEGELVIYDMNGKIIYSQPVFTNQQTIHLGAEHKGIYLVYFYGKKHATGKILVR